MAPYLELFIRLLYMTVPNFMLVRINPQFLCMDAPICLTKKSCAAYNLLQKCASVLSTKTPVSHGTSPSHVEFS